MKRKFVQRRAMLKIKADAAAHASTARRSRRKVAGLLGGTFEELAFAEHVLDWQEDEAAQRRDARRSRSASRLGRAHGRRPLALPRRRAVQAAATRRPDAPGARCTTDTLAGYTVHTLHHIRRREGFALTDPGTDLAGALDQANYCIWCHEQGKDSCSKGLKEKPADDGDGRLQEERVRRDARRLPARGEHLRVPQAQERGLAIGALAMIVVDNPMVAATGHRICNDCMKSCIYQKQEPVDIPQAETRTLKDVLELPWGFEIYSLLTRWNPLNLRRPLSAAGDRQARAGGRHGARRASRSRTT